MFEVSSEIQFCYGHRLLNYAGKCRHLHGHNGKAIITLMGKTLDDRGMLVDFGDLKRTVTQWIDDNLDHRMVLCEQDPMVKLLHDAGEPLYIVPFNPTAENIARLIFEKAVEAGLPVKEVGLWETSKNYAVYRPEA